MPQVPLLMKVLSYAGIIPFIGLFLIIWLQPPQIVIDLTNTALWMMAYAAIILSFLGAIHWGMLLNSSDQEISSVRITQMLIWGASPAVLAWLCMLLPIPIALIALAVLIVLAYVVDRLWILATASAGYSTLRLHLTLAVATLLLLSGLKLAIT